MIPLNIACSQTFLLQMVQDTTTAMKIFRRSTQNRTFRLITKLSDIQKTTFELIKTLDTKQDRGNFKKQKKLSGYVYHDETL